MPFAFRDGIRGRSGLAYFCVASGSGDKPDSKNTTFSAAHKAYVEAPSSAVRESYEQCIVASCISEAGNTTNFERSSRFPNKSNIATPEKARSKVIQILVLFHHCSVFRDLSKNLDYSSSRLFFFFAHPPLSIHNWLFVELVYLRLALLRAYFAIIDSYAKFAHPT